MGFISGVAGGKNNNSILFGICNSFDLCHVAPSQTKRIRSSGLANDNPSKNKFIHTVLLYGNTRKNDLPVNGSTAPHNFCRKVCGKNAAVNLPRRYLPVTICVTIFPNMVTGRCRTNAFLTPAIFRFVNAPKPGFIFKH